MSNTLPGTRPEGARDERDVARTVQDMFSRIAPRYDLLNRLLSFSLDRVWRRRTTRAVAPRLASADSSVLDLCCGTADLTLELARASRGQVIGSDFAHPMLTLARQKAARANRAVALVEADALRLPFPDNSFDAVTIAFGFRNLANYRRGLEEIHRVLKPGGEAAILEFSRPERGLFSVLFRFYFRRIVPRIGGTISGVRGPYSYLPVSVEHFPACDEFVRWMEAAGLRPARCERWTFGTIALYRGLKA